MHRDDSGDPAAVDIEATAEELAVQSQVLLEPFRAQGFAIRSLAIADAGPDRRLSPGARIFGIGEGGTTRPRGSASPLIVPNADAEGQDALAHLSRRAAELCGSVEGGDLLVAPTEALAAMIGSAGATASFRAIAAIMPGATASDNLERTLRRGLFDDGLVSIGSVELGSRTLMLFLASDAVHAKERLDAGGRRQITMSSLGSNGRFANQLFQYAFLKLYALRHGTGMTVPDWPGKTLFGLDDPGGAGIELPELAFQGFSNEHLELWRAPNPPSDVDFWGYFQEIPSCWRPHRQLLRTLFELPAAARNSLDAWHKQVTANGKRTLVAIHLRRTDYRLSELPWFRLIPEEWYLDWLRKVWPSLTDPVLFVATDEPQTVLPHFAEFSPKSSVDLGGLDLPDHVRDFEILRRADWLAICNSSFSRMAAILARETQRCFLPSISGQCIVPYDPWNDSGFWTRFGDAAKERPDPSPIRLGTGGEPRAPSVASLYLDVTDLLLHLRSHPTLSGIQRVQCELACNLSGQTQFPRMRFTVFGQNELAEIAKADLLEILERARLGSAASPALRRRIRNILAEATPANLQAGDVLFMTGAYWAVSGIGRFVQRLKNSGVTIGIFVHDILPISRPEYFQADAGAALARPVAEALELADFLVTSSNYNRDALAAYRSARRLGPVPIEIVPLGHVLPKPSGGKAELGPELAALLESEFVLCVGTIEIRKNPSYLLNIWKLMVDAGRDAIPTLVFAGRNGWLVDDFFEQLKACDRLDGKIVLLHDLSDRTLDLLYRRCLLTMFPSFEEGWGLPVGESLSYGKICLASRTGGIPEVGGQFADYLDPYNIRDGYDRLIRYLDDPGLRLRREKEIADRFSLRSWRNHADGIVSSVKEQMKTPAKADVIAAVSLPANEFLAIGVRVAGTSRRAVDGFFSADSACVSGWGALAKEGIPASGPVSVLRFRTGLPQGSKVTAIFRLSASRLGPCRLRIRSESEAGQAVRVRRGQDRMAAVSREIGADGLVTFTFERTDIGRFLPADLCPWKLKGFLYIQPRDLGAIPSEPVTKTEGTRSFGAADAETSVRVAPSEAAVRDVGSLAAFLQTPDARWPAATKATIRRRAPVFAGPEDRRLFLSRYRNSRSTPLGAVPDDIALRRLRNPHVSTARFSEGSIFDRSGVVKDFGFLQVETEREAADWLARDRAGVRVGDDALALAPHFDGTFAIFFNGNLHNYYHWVAEGLLGLDVLAQTIGDGLDLRIVLPKTMDINAVFDHRASLATLGFDKWPIIEAPPPIVRLGEAVWVESGDFMEGVPAAQVKRFQQRIASLYAGRRGPRNRRLLVQRFGPAREIGNLAEVEAFLYPHGFETVQLEGASIEEQVVMFQRAEFVVGAHGAGLTNLLFCEPGTKVIEFMPMVEMRPFFWLISEKLGLRHAMQFCPGVEGVGFQASIHVDTDKLRRLYELIESR